MDKKIHSAFTLVETLIVVLIVSILAIATIILLDPLTMVNKGVDAQRKTELNTFKKLLEEYYTDNGCYPKLTEVCFSGGINGDVTNKTSCIMCGTEATSPLLTGYSESLPCDPKYPTSVYLYAINSSAGTTEKACPKSFTLYSKLGVPEDIDSLRLGCGEGGCGVSPNYGYDYGVASPQTSLGASASFFCLSDVSFTCNTCGLYEDCLHDPSRHCQTDKIYATGAICRSTTGAP